jgi:hypothetical protein
MACYGVSEYRMVDGWWTGGGRVVDGRWMGGGTYSSLQFVNTWCSRITFEYHISPCIKKTVVTQRYKVESTSVGACVSGCARASYDDAGCTSAPPQSETETDHVERDSRNLLISTSHQQHTLRPTPPPSA